MINYEILETLSKFRPENLEQANALMSHGHILLYFCRYFIDNKVHIRRMNKESVFINFASLHACLFF